MGTGNQFTVSPSCRLSGRYTTLEQKGHDGEHILLYNITFLMAYQPSFSVTPTRISLNFQNSGKTDLYAVE